jgi:hypothetical protein
MKKKTSSSSAADVAARRDALMNRFFDPRADMFDVWEVNRVEILQRWGPVLFGQTPEDSFYYMWSARDTMFEQLAKATIESIHPSPNQTYENIYKAHGGQLIRMFMETCRLRNLPCPESSLAKFYLERAWANYGQVTTSAGTTPSYVAEPDDGYQATLNEMLEQLLDQYCQDEDIDHVVEGLARAIEFSEAQTGMVFHTPREYIDHLYTLPICTEVANALDEAYLLSTDQSYWAEIVPHICIRDA